jgi:AcrR family transcriptional regulator
MESKRRTQADRSAATRGALVAAARRLWGERGYAAVGTPEVARAAGVTRGAMYHQFADKLALFAAVVEAVEEDVGARLTRRIAEAGATRPGEALRVAVDGWLEISAEPEVRQLVLLDAPAVLGWAAFRDVAQRHGLGMAERLLQAAMDAGEIPRQPVRALAHVLIGALDEAVLLQATAEDPAAARGEVREVLRRLLDGLLAPAPGSP